MLIEYIRRGYLMKTNYLLKQLNYLTSRTAIEAVHAVRQSRTSSQSFLRCV
ncbi:hypothetical protein TPE_0097 [Treponema pedis str. T A4]|uniref:Uncharacterized protein n=1 Tax=Treponema pedis str. T A4 TaxID=1291379 RepID=S5ZRF7_9SPIR|nr:hypothetical protein TPE_0097 [Treponema pedis str. T A4]